MNTGATQASSRSNALLRTRISKYVISGVVMTIAMQLGNIIDAMVVGQLLGADPMAAISLCSPVVLIQQIPGSLLGFGAAIQASIACGRHDRKRAEGLYTLTLIIVGLCSLLLMLAGLFFSPQIAAALSGGVDSELYGYVNDYVRVNLLGAAALNYAIAFTYFMLNDNNQQLGAVLFVIASVFNAVMDVVFIKVFHAGMDGVAAATVVGYVMGMVVLIPYMRSKSRMLRLTKCLKGWGGMLVEAVKAGLPTALRSVLYAVSSFIINSIIIYNFSNDGMSIYALCRNLLMIGMLVLGGPNSLISTMCGSLYGARDYVGLRYVCKLILRISYALLCAIIAAYWIFTGAFALLFGVKPAFELYDVALWTVRLYTLCFPMLLINQFRTMYYEATEKSSVANVIVVFSQFLFIIPATLCLVSLARPLGTTYGIYAIALSMSVSEGLTLLGTRLVKRFMQKREKLPPSRDWMLIDSTDETRVDYCTIGNAPEDTELLCKWVDSSCAEKNVPAANAEALHMAAKEISTAIVRNGYPKATKRARTIDALLFIDDERQRLAIRDDGVTLEPSEYLASCPDAEMGGPELKQTIIEHVTFVRALGLNNTVIELESKPEKA